MGDEMKKVQPGDPLRIPAPTYNRFIDVARAHQEKGTRFGKGLPGDDLAANTTIALNNSGEDVARYSALAISGHVGGNIEILSFTKPAADTDVPAVALEPIPNGKYGLIAVAGGPYKVLVDGSVSAGDDLGLVAGTWTFSTAGRISLQSLTDDSAGECYARFQTPGHSSMIIAQADMVTDDTPYNVKYLEADGTEGTQITARRPNGIYVSNGDVGFMGWDSSGHSMFLPANMRAANEMPSVMQVVTSDPSSPVAGQFWFNENG